MTPLISAWAAAIVTPSRSRATTSRLCTPRRSRKGTEEARGSHTCASPNPTPGGSTPTTSVACASSWIVRPTMPGSPPYARIHSSCPSTATRGPPATSSADASSRPSAGRAPSVGRNDAVAAAPGTRSGGPEAGRRFTSGKLAAASRSKLRARAR